MAVESGIISEIREKSALTRSEFAALLGVSENYLYRVETGSRKPGMKLLWQISKLSGVPMENLMNVSKEPDGPEIERVFSGARMYLEAVNKLRRERHNRKDLEERNSELEHAIEHLMALIHLHLQFEDIVCQGLSKSQMLKKIEELAKITAEEGEATFDEMLVTFRVKRPLLKSWLTSGKQIYKCLFIDGLEVTASTPGEAALRLCCFDCIYHESKECAGYGGEKRPENIIALLARMEANGIYNRSEQAKLLEESYGITISAHQIAEVAYRHKNDIKIPEGAFNLDAHSKERMK